jgi:hypothetical protein
VSEQLPSNRSVGAVFIVFFGLVAALQFWKGGTWAWLWLVLAGLVAFVTVVAPDLLTPFNRAWMALGRLLNKVVSPIVLGAMYFLLITPIGLIMRASGRDPMQRGFDPQTSSYWIQRDPPGPAPETLKQQF